MAWNWNKSALRAQEFISLASWGNWLRIPGIGCGHFPSVYSYFFFSFTFFIFNLTRLVTTNKRQPLKKHKRKPLNQNPEKTNNSLTLTQTWPIKSQITTLNFKKSKRNVQILRQNQDNNFFCSFLASLFQIFYFYDCGAAILFMEIFKFPSLLAVHQITNLIASLNQLNSYSFSFEFIKRRSAKDGPPHLNLFSLHFIDFSPSLCLYLSVSLSFMSWNLYFWGNHK